MSEQEPVHLRRGQIETLRDHCYSDAFRRGQQARNETIITLFADTGIRVGELVQLKTENLSDDNEYLILPPEIQKTYQQNTPGIVKMELGKVIPDTPRTVTKYLRDRKSDSEYLFPSRQADTISKQAVRNMVKRVAVEADVQPYAPDGTRRDPDSLHPHAFRHSIAHTMLEGDGDATIDDVKRRLRHKRRETTEDTYSHFLVV
jgi:integrase/recombinase XerC/integrase/recombinase XerD